jgi:hypothetical protein
MKTGGADRQGRPGPCGQGQRCSKDQPVNDSPQMEKCRLQGLCVLPGFGLIAHFSLRSIFPVIFEPFPVIANYFPC